MAKLPILTSSLIKCDLIKLGKIDILTIISLPIHGRIVFLCLFRLSLIYFVFMVSA